MTTLNLVKNRVKKLNKMGYPEAHTSQAKSILKKAKSYTSCIIGKLKA